MGVQDLDRIHPVYRARVDYGKAAVLPFKFKVDSGNYETGLEFIRVDWCPSEFITHHPPISKNWDSNPNIVCPDILILKFNRPIGVIEFEEETGNKKSGAHYAKRGHGHYGDIDTKRDSRRNEFYKESGLQVFRLWELNFKTKNWKTMIHKFLLDCV